MTTVKYTGLDVLCRKLQAPGDGNGVAALAGDFYNHCLVTVGYDAGTGGGNRNGLTHPHQVGFYSAVKGNAVCTGLDSWVIGFETALGIDVGGLTCRNVASFSIGSFGVGAGSTVERIIGYMTHEETVGTIGNAAIAAFATADSFIGNWYLYYAGQRPSKLGGPLRVSSLVTDNAIRMEAGDLVLPGGTSGIATAVSAAGTGTVSAAGGTLTFSTSQAGVVTVGSIITVDGVDYPLVTFNGTTSATVSGAPTFSARAFRRTSAPVRVISIPTGATPKVAFIAGISIGAGADLSLPGGGFGIDNGTTRFMAVGSGATPTVGFAFAVGINGKTPVTSVAAPTAAGAAYTATEQALLNDIRTRLINFGIYS